MRSLATASSWKSKIVQMDISKIKSNSSIIFIEPTIWLKVQHEQEDEKPG